MTCWQGKRSQTVQFTKQISESRKLYLARHEIAHVAGIKKRRGEKRDPPPFSLLFYPSTFQRLLHATHEKEGGCVTFGEGGEEKCDPPPFFPSP